MLECTQSDTVPSLVYTVQQSIQFSGYCQAMYNIVQCKLQSVMESILSELLNNALSPQIAADPAPGTEKLIASHSKDIHRVPYYQLAAQAEQKLMEQEQQSSQALQQQVADAAAADEAAVTALKQQHQTEVDYCVIPPV